MDELKPEEIMAILHWYNCAENDGNFTDSGTFLHPKGFIKWNIDEDALLKKFRSELDKRLDLVDSAE